MALPKEDQREQNKAKSGSTPAKSMSIGDLRKQEYAGATQRTGINLGVAGGQGGTGKVKGASVGKAGKAGAAKSVSGVSSDDYDGSSYQGASEQGSKHATGSEKRQESESTFDRASDGGKYEATETEALAEQSRGIDSPVDVTGKSVYETYDAADRFYRTYGYEPEWYAQLRESPTHSDDYDAWQAEHEKRLTQYDEADAFYRENGYNSEAYEAMRQNPTHSQDFDLWQMTRNGSTVYDDNYTPWGYVEGEEKDFRDAVIAATAEAWKKEWMYDIYGNDLELSDEDRARMANGEMPRFWANMYDLNDPLEKYLYEHGLPINEGTRRKLSDKATEQVIADYEYKAKESAFQEDFYNLISENPSMSVEDAALYMQQSGQYDEIFENFTDTRDSSALSASTKDIKSSNPYYFNLTDLEGIVEPIRNNEMLQFKGAFYLGMYNARQAEYEAAAEEGRSIDYDNIDAAEIAHDLFATGQYGYVLSKWGESPEPADEYATGEEKIKALKTAGGKKKEDEVTVSSIMGDYPEFERALKEGNEKLLLEKFGVQLNKDAAAAQAAKQAENQSEQALPDVDPDVLQAQYDDLQTQVAAKKEEISAIDLEISGYERMSTGAAILEEKRKERKKLVAERDSLLSQRDAIFGITGEQNILLAKKAIAEQYSDIPQREDYAEKSDALTLSEEWDSKQKQSVAQVQNTYERGWSLSTSNPYYSCAYMEESEIGTFRYLVRTQGADAGLAYVDTLMPVLNERNYKNIDRKTNEWVDKSPVLHSILSIFQKQGSSVEGYSSIIGGGLFEATSGKRGREYVYQDPRTTGTQINSSIREKREAEIAATHGELQGMLYSMGMSIADNAFRAAAFAGGGKIGSAISASSVYGQVAASTVNEYMLKGATAKEAMLMGTLSGAAEAIGEAVDMSALLRIKDASALAKAGKAITGSGVIRRAVAKNIATEAGSEGVTEIANYMFDWLVMQDQAKWRDTYNESIAAGKSSGQAVLDSILKVLADVGFAALGGGISGGVLGLGGALANSFSIGKSQGATGAGAISAGNRTQADYIGALVGVQSETTITKKDYNTKKSESNSFMASYEQAIKQGTAAEPATRMKVMSDLAGLGMDKAEAENIMTLYDAFASSPSSIMSKEAVSALSTFTESVQRAADLTKTIDAQKVARDVKTKQRLTSLFNGIQQYQGDAQAAMQAGDLAGQAKALNSLRQAVRAYKDAYKSASVTEDAKSVTDEIAKRKAAEQITGGAAQMDEMVERETAYQLAMLEQRQIDEISESTGVDRGIIDMLVNGASDPNASGRLDGARLAAQTDPYDIIGGMYNADSTDGSAGLGTRNGSIEDTALRGTTDKNAGTPAANAAESDAQGTRNLDETDNEIIEAAKRSYKEKTGRDMDVAPVSSVSEKGQAAAKNFSMITGKPVAFVTTGGAHGFNNGDRIYATDKWHIGYTLGHEYVETNANGMMDRAKEVPIPDNLKKLYVRARGRRLKAEYGLDYTEKNTRDDLHKEMIADMGGVFFNNVITGDPLRYTALFFTKKMREDYESTPQGKASLAAYETAIQELAQKYEAIFAAAHEDSGAIENAEDAAALASESPIDRTESEQAYTNADAAHTFDTVESEESESIGGNRVPHYRVGDGEVTLIDNEEYAAAIDDEGGQDIGFSTDAPEETATNDQRRPTFAQDVMRTARNEYGKGTTAAQWWERNKSGYGEREYRIGLQLQGMAMRNGERVGGRLATDEMQDIVDDAAQFKKQHMLSVKSPIRVFENAGRWRDNRTDEGMFLNMHASQRYGELYYTYGQEQLAQRNKYVKDKMDAVRSIEADDVESVLAQVMGEFGMTEAQMQAARKDGKHIYIPIADGALVLDNKGRPEYLCDSKALYVYDDNFLKAHAQMRREIAALVADKAGKNSDKIRELEKQYKAHRPVELTEGYYTVTSGNKYGIFTSAGTPIFEMDGQPAYTDRVKALKDTLSDVYAEMHGMVQDTLVSNGYRPAGKRENYFPHIGRQATGINEVVQYLQSEDLPVEIAGLTESFTPGKSFARNLMERTGEYTDYNSVKGFNSYIESVSDVVYMTPYIQRLRQLESALRTGKATKNSIDVNINEENANLTTWLHEYTNGIANKKSTLDRGGESVASRKFYTVYTRLNGGLGMAKTAGNVATAVSQLVPFAQNAGQLNPKYTMRGAWDALFSGVNGTDGDGFNERSSFLANRQNASDQIMTSLGKKYKQTGMKVLYSLMSGMDAFCTRSVARSKYYELMDKGHSTDDAIRLTDAYCTKLFADRTKGARPTVFNSKLLAPLTMFQLEPLNQMWHYRDIHRDNTLQEYERILKNNHGVIDGIDFAKAENQINRTGILWRDAAKIIGRLIALSLLGAGTRALGLGDKTWNPLGMAIDAVEDYKSGGMQGVATGLAETAASNLPFVSTVERGPAMMQAVTDTMEHFNDSEEEQENASTGGDFWDILAGSPALNLVPGGAQIKKTTEGLRAVGRGGNYSDSGRLRYPIEQTAGNYVKGALFGKSSLAPNGYKWGADVLSKSETAAYKQADASGVEEFDMYDFLLNGYDKSNNAMKLLSLAAADPPPNEAGAIADALGITYKGNIDKAARTAGKKRALDLKKDLKKGVITQENYDEKMAAIDFYLQIIGG